MNFPALWNPCSLSVSFFSLETKKENDSQFPYKMRYVFPVEITVHCSILIHHYTTVNEKTMAHIPPTSALVLFLQVTVLKLIFFPMTANCLSLDDRWQMKQLEDYVRNYDFVFDCESFSYFKQFSTFII